ncbi:zinc-binding alcohol dehydrogenase family protein [Kineococcus sp. TBRC 1896]|uniref:Zinc-binding alcohol dehydrogenase family protein n=1 Tax=Kineococcus mangrovi TaxID=1660183 RepID=A0ABV4I6V8_9ACTN
MTDTMRALIAGRGPDWVLDDVPVPRPGPGQVLVRVRAAAVNNADLPLLAAADPTAGGHGDEFVAGYEYAGEVAAVGAGAGHWRVGDPVMGSIPSSFAEFVVADHRFVVPRPAGLAPHEAVALPTGLLTEHGALTVAGFRPGQSVLVTGASTGIGLVGVQVAKALGASRVIGTTRSPDKRDLLTSVGVDDVVVTGEQDLTGAVLTATGGEGVDVVLDHVGGRVFADCLPATRHDGHVVNIGRLAGPASTVDLDALSYRHLSVHGVSFGFTRAQETAGVVAGLLPEVLPAVERGAVRPVLDRVFPVDRAGEIAAHVRSGRGTGKVVVALDG